MKLRVHIGRLSVTRYWTTLFGSTKDLASVEKTWKVRKEYSARGRLREMNESRPRGICFLHYIRVIQHVFVYTLWRVCLASFYFIFLISKLEIWNEKWESNVLFIYRKITSRQRHKWNESFVFILSLFPFFSERLNVWWIFTVVFNLEFINLFAHTRKSSGRLCNVTK